MPNLDGEWPSPSTWEKYKKIKTKSHTIGYHWEATILDNFQSTLSSLIALHGHISDYVARMISSF